MSIDRREAQKKKKRNQGKNPPLARLRVHARLTYNSYALQWLVIIPLENLAAVKTLKFWRGFPIPDAVSVTIFLLCVFGVNLLGVRAYGEAEFVASFIKIAAVVGFAILGIIIDIAGNQDVDTIGSSRFMNPSPFHNGFKGFGNVLVTAAFAFSGTELVGLAAAETYKPAKSIPKAVRHLFWSIFGVSYTQIWKEKSFSLAADTLTWIRTVLFRLCRRNRPRRQCRRPPPARGGRLLRHLPLRDRYTRRRPQRS